MIRAYRDWSQPGFIRVQNADSALYFIAMSAKGFHPPAYSDPVIHYMFGSTGNERIILSFINAVLADREDLQMTDVKVLNPFNPAKYLDGKASVLDLRARGADGNLYNIEVQARKDPQFKKRALYYWGKSFTGQLDAGEDYRLLKPVISINLLAFSYFKTRGRFHRRFSIHDDDGDEDPEDLVHDEMAIHYLEMPKMNFTDHPSRLDCWVEWIRNKEKGKDMEKVIQNDEGLQLADQAYERFVSDEQMRYMYDAWEEGERDVKTRINIARDEGIAEAKREDALKMLDEGLEAELVSRVTGFTLSEVEDLKNRS